MINIKQLNLKGKLLILNEISKQATETIKLYKETVKPEVAEAEDKRLEVENVGHFTLSNNSVKTVETLITEKQQAMEKLQKEIEDLQAMDKNLEITTKQGNLNCYTTEEAKQIANELLKELIATDLNSKALRNKAKGIARVK